MGELYQSGCVDETTAARLLDRALSAVEHARVARHIDRCGDCRRFLSALARSKMAERL